MISRSSCLYELKECTVRLRRVDDTIDGQRVISKKMTQTIDNARGAAPCRICNEGTISKQYGIPSCRACLSFSQKLKDGNKLKEAISLSCKKSSGSSHDIRKCRPCRAKKCIEVGFNDADVASHGVSRLASSVVEDNPDSASSGKTVAADSKLQKANCKRKLKPEQQVSPVEPDSAPKKLKKSSKENMNKADPAETTSDKVKKLEESSRLEVQSKKSKKNHTSKAVAAAEPTIDKVEKLEEGSGQEITKSKKLKIIPKVKNDGAVKKKKPSSGQSKNVLSTSEKESGCDKIDKQVLKTKPKKDDTPSGKILSNKKSKKAIHLSADTNTPSKIVTRDKVKVQKHQKTSTKEKSKVTRSIFSSFKIPLHSSSASSKRICSLPENSVSSNIHLSSEIISPSKHSALSKVSSQKKRIISPKILSPQQRDCSPSQRINSQKNCSSLLNESPFKVSIPVKNKSPFKIPQKMLEIRSESCTLETDELDYEYRGEEENNENSSLHENENDVTSEGNIEDGMCEEDQRSLNSLAFSVGSSENLDGSFSDSENFEQQEDDADESPIKEECVEPLLGNTQENMQKDSEKSPGLDQVFEDDEETIQIESFNPCISAPSVSCKEDRWKRLDDNSDSESDASVYEDSADIVSSNNHESSGLLALSSENCSKEGEETTDSALEEKFAFPMPFPKPFLKPFPKPLPLPTNSFTANSTAECNDDNEDDMISLFAPNENLLESGTSLQGLSWASSKPSSASSASSKSTPVPSTSPVKPSLNFTLVPSKSPTPKPSALATNKRNSNPEPKTVTKPRRLIRTNVDSIKITLSNTPSEVLPKHSQSPLPSPKFKCPASIKKAHRTAKSPMIFNKSSTVTSSSSPFSEAALNDESPTAAASNVTARVDTSLEIFNNAIMKRDLKAAKKIYSDKKNILNVDLQKEMVSKLIKLKLEMKLTTDAFAYLPDMKRLRFENGAILKELFDVCGSLPDQRRQIVGEFVDYLIAIKYNIDGVSLRKILDELLDKKDAASVWKLLKYAKSKDYRPSVKLCKWAIEELDRREDELETVLAHFYKLKEEVEKFCPKSIEKLRKFTKKHGGLDDAAVRQYLSQYKFHMYSPAIVKVAASTSSADSRRSLWRRFLEAEQPDEQLLNDLFKNLCENFSEVAQSFLSFYNFVKGRCSVIRPSFRTRIMTKLGFCVIMECYEKKAYKSAYSVISTLFSDKKNHFQLLEVNDCNSFITVFQMALACMEICMHEKDDAFALTVLKASDGALPSENNNNASQRLLRLRIIHALFKKRDTDESDYNTQVYLFNCLVQSNEEDIKLLKYHWESEHGLLQIYQKLMYRFIERNVFELARTVYEIGRKNLLVVTEECCRGYMVLLQRNSLYLAEGQHELYGLLTRCQTRGFYSMFNNFDDAESWKIMIKSYFTIEEMIVILQLYFEKLLKYLLEQSNLNGQYTLKTVWIIITERQFTSSLSLLTNLTLNTVERVALALAKLNLSIDLEASTYGQVRVNEASLRALIFANSTFNLTR